MDEETLAVVELESLQRMAAQSKTGAVMNSPEKHKQEKNHKSYKSVIEDNKNKLKKVNRAISPHFIDTVQLMCYEEFSVKLILLFLWQWSIMLEIKL